MFALLLACEPAPIPVDPVPADCLPDEDDVYCLPYTDDADGCGAWWDLCVDPARANMWLRTFSNPDMQHPCVEGDCTEAEAEIKCEVCGC